MLRKTLLLIYAATVVAPALHLHRSLDLLYGSLSPFYGRVVCTDLNQNGLQDMCFFTGSIFPEHPPRWEIWEWRTFDRSVIAYADTAPYPYPQGIQTGFFRLYTAGDLDRDGLPELWGIMHEELEFPAYRYLLACMESPQSGAWPTSLVWHERVDSSAGSGRQSIWQTDLDRDSHKEIVLQENMLGDFMLCLFENTGDDDYRLVWGCNDVMYEYVACGDFDLDARMDMAYFGEPSRVRECQGDNRYEPVCELGNPPGHNDEVWPGQDVNRNGKPEFWTGTYVYLGGPWRFYLCCWEAVADNAYDWVCVDSVDRAATYPGNTSTCGDVDGDGIEEVIWATGTHIAVYDCTRPGTVEKVAEEFCVRRYQDYLCVTTHDLDQNGYNEIIVGGMDGLDVFEIDAVRVLAPMPGAEVRPGDTCLISWQVYDPPPCDSVSLFLRCDTSYSLDTIATRLGPADTSYVWVVPDIRSESCWVMAIAYNHGLWQYDETDGPLRVVVGIAEPGQPVAYTDRLDVVPNPSSGPVRISYELSRPGDIELVVYDRAGRKAATLAAGFLEPGRYCLTWARKGAAGTVLPAGVYFLRLETGQKLLTSKLTLTE